MTIDHSYMCIQFKFSYELINSLTMQQMISQEAPLTQRYMEVGSVLQTERNELQETLSKVTSNEEAQRGN
jgi:hypothetical protein